MHHEILHDYLQSRGGKFKARTRRALSLVVEKGLRPSDAARAIGMSKQQMNGTLRRYEVFYALRFAELNSPSTLICSLD